MKKSKLLLCFIAIAMTFIFLGIIEVKAEKYTGQAIWPREFVDGIYLRKTSASGVTKVEQGRFLRRSEDNKFIYCLEPFVEVDNGYIYDVARSDFAAILGLTEEQWQRVSLLAFYGYIYDQNGYDHTDPKWYTITQVMIWRTVEPDADIYFTNTMNGTRNDSLFTSEMAEIEKLVANHSKKPNFNISNDTLSLGNSVTFVDSNGVLSDYTMTSSNNLSVSKNGNEITITPTSLGDGKITFTRTFNIYSSDPVLYYSVQNQDAMRVGNVDPITTSIDFKIIGGKVTIKKLDRDTGEAKGLGDGVLSGATYGIYDMSGTLITKVITGEDGTIQSSVLPYLGSYKLKEISSSIGYELDTNEYTFDISEDNLYPTVTVYEQVIKRQIQINKYYANGETGNLIPEGNITFEIYDKNNELVVSITTDENGYATFNLPYGTYTAKQVNTTDGYEKVSDFTITVNENSPEVINYSLSNAPITAKLKLVKIDSESNKTITVSGITFKIKDLSNNDYVCQSVTYPSKREICEYQTDEQGEFITPYPLMPGQYEIEEISSPAGYLLNEEGVIFTIDNSSNIIVDDEYGNFIKIEFVNEKIMGEVVIEKTGDLFNVEDGTFTYTTAKLSGIEFSIYADEDIITLDGVKHYSKGDLISTIITNEDGSAKFENLYLGKYVIKETKTLNEYVLDTTEYKIELNEVDNKTAIVSEILKVNNKLKKGTLEFTKLDLENSKVIPDTLIEIYAINDELIFSGLTNEDGEVIITDLKVGKYYILEKESATGYVITDEIVYFEITEDEAVVQVSMTNKPIQGTLEFTKIDISTSEPLPNTIIEIYTEKDELVFEGKTDENGMIIIEELRYGKYYILEKQAPEGYILNEEKMFFEIKEDGEIIKATMVNEKVIIEVPNTGLNDTYVVEIIGTFLIISGIGVIIYANKKRKKK